MGNLPLKMIYIKAHVCQGLLKVKRAEFLVTRMYDHLEMMCGRRAEHAQK
jgi:hypothetical protein